MREMCEERRERRDREGDTLQEEREKQVTTVVEEKLGQTQYALTNDIL